MDKNICSKCGIEKNGNNYYQTRGNAYFKHDNIKRMLICKDCFRTECSINLLETFKKYNIPFLYNIWDICYDTYSDVHISSYMSKINSLPQYKNLKWKDSILDKSQNEPEDIKSEINFYDEIVINLKSEAEKLNNRLEKIRDNNDMNLYISTLKSLKETLNLIKEYDWILNYSEYGIEDGKRQVAIWEENNTGNIRNHKVWDIKIDGIIDKTVDLNKTS